MPAPSPTVVNSPPSPPLASSKAPVSPPSWISTPAEAPGLAQNGSILDKVKFAAGSGFAAVLDLGSLLDLLDLGLLSDLLDLGSLPLWIWVHC